jgi:hypothetical protein
MHQVRLDSGHIWSTDDRGITRTEPVGPWGSGTMDPLGRLQWVLRGTEFGAATWNRAAIHACVTLQPTLALANSV